MTECSQLGFGFLGRREVVGRFDGGRVSSDGGLLLLREVDRRFGVTEAVAGRLRDRRHPGKVRQSLHDLVRQRVYQIACGYEDCNDAATLAGDPVFKAAVDRAPDSDPDLASQPTLSRFENSLSRTNLYRAAQVLIDLFVARTAPPRRIILDLDATDDPTHGQQQFSFFHGYYDTYCYLPLLCFASADGGPQQLLAAVLRPGNVHAGAKTVVILKRLVAQLRQAWPDTPILLRGDSGLALPEVYDWCEANGVDYLIGLARNSRLQALAEPFLTVARDEHRQTQVKVRHLHEVRYAAESWPAERRVILKAEVTAQGDNPRFVVTSLEGDPPEDLYELYAQRGDVENRIKELKNDLAADRTSCHRFLANQARLLLHAIAFVLLTLLRGLLAGTELAAAQAGTLRLRLLKVGVRVRQTVRKLWLHFASAYPWQHLWRLVLDRLRAAPA
jgi:hypothetical protein